MAEDVDEQSGGKGGVWRRTGLLVEVILMECHPSRSVGLWARYDKEMTHETSSPAYAGACDP